MRHYRDLTVWQRSMDLIVECYRVSDRFPRAERFELTRQLRRAAISVAANIAEGNGRSHTREYLHHLSISTGSLNELTTYLELALRLGYATDADLRVCFEHSEAAGRMLTSLKRSLGKRLGA